MRIYLCNELEKLIELDAWFLKANYRSRKNYSIELATLENRLTFDSSLLPCKLSAHYLTDFQ